MDGAGGVASEDEEAVSEDDLERVGALAAVAAFGVLVQVLCFTEGFWTASGSPPSPGKGEIWAAVGLGGVVVASAGLVQAWREGFLGALVGGGLFALGLAVGGDYSVRHVARPELRMFEGLDTYIILFVQLGLISVPVLLGVAYLARRRGFPWWPTPVLGLLAFYTGTHAMLLLDLLRHADAVADISQAVVA